MNEAVVDNCKKILVAGCRQLGIVLDRRRQEAFMAYLAALQRWNRSYNLTAVKSEEEIISRHFLDSLAFLPFLSGISGPVLDLGTGAGFPGLPLALLLPAVHFLLVDARQKKTLFLEHVSRILGLENVTILHLHLRKVNGSTELKGPVEVLVSRAVSVTDEVFPLAGELLVPGGMVLLSSTKASQVTIIKALSCHDHLRLQDITKVTIPFLGQQRHMMRIIRE